MCTREAKCSVAANTKTINKTLNTYKQLLDSSPVLNILAETVSLGTGMSPRGTGMAESTLEWQCASADRFLFAIRLRETMEPEQSVSPFVGINGHLPVPCFACCSSVAQCCSYLGSQT